LHEFTKDFFTKNISNFVAISEALGPIDNALEIGSYQGRSACWILENMLSDTGKLVCVDPFTHQDSNPWSMDYPHDGNPEIAKRFWHNINESKKPKQTVELLTMRSYPAMASLINEKRQFDFVYIDGNHSAATSLADACMAFGLTRVGGIMLFDDYMMRDFDDPLVNCKMSIDSFVNLFARYVEPIINNYQVGVMRSR